MPGFYIGVKEYIANKRAAGRMKDLANIEALGEIRSKSALRNSIESHLADGFFAELAQAQKQKCSIKNRKSWDLDRDWDVRIKLHERPAQSFAGIHDRIGEPRHLSVGNESIVFQR